MKISIKKRNLCKEKNSYHYNKVNINIVHYLTTFITCVYIYYHKKGIYKYFFHEWYHWFINCLRLWLVSKVDIEDNFNEINETAPDKKRRSQSSYNPKKKVCTDRSFNVLDEEGEIEKRIKRKGEYDRSINNENINERKICELDDSFRVKELINDFNRHDKYIILKLINGGRVIIRE